jgi:LAS superfamily LD-carboxypeptidase LdcB
VSHRAVGSGCSSSTRRPPSAFKALRQAAQKAGFPKDAFSLKSALRSQKRQEEIKASAAPRHPGSKDESRWVAQGKSEYLTGRTVDLNLDKKITNSRENARAGKFANLETYKWLKENAGKFGFNPYRREPWHWAYNVRP